VRRPHLRTILLVLLILAAAGGAYALTRGDGDQQADSLVVEFRSDEGAAPVVRNIDCNDAGTAQVCAALTPALLQPVPKAQVCTMIYGGPQTATVTGWLRGSAVKAKFSRTNGCEIARWDQLAKALKPLAIWGLGG